MWECEVFCFMQGNFNSEAPKKKPRKPRTKKQEKPMSPGRRELHRIVREAMEKGFGTHYGDYVSTLPRPVHPPKKKENAEAEGVETGSAELAEIPEREFKEVS